MTVDEAIQQPGELVGAWDGAATGHEWLGIYAVGDGGAKLLAHERTDAAGRQRREAALRARKIRIGDTVGGEHVWTNDGARELVAWNRTQRLFVATRSDVRVRDLVVPLGRIQRVASFVDRFDLGRRGVGIECTGAPPVVLVEEHDPTPAMDPTYDRSNVALDAAWASALGRDLSGWLGVPHDDQIP